MHEERIRVFFAAAKRRLCGGMKNEPISVTSSSVLEMLRFIEKEAQKSEIELSSDFTVFRDDLMNPERARAIVEKARMIGFAGM